MGQAFCIRCKQKVAVMEGRLAYYSNGTPVEKGTCEKCGCKVTRMLKKEERLALRENQKLNEEPTSEESELNA